MKYVIAFTRNAFGGLVMGFCGLLVMSAGYWISDETGRRIMIRGLLRSLLQSFNERERHRALEQIAIVVESMDNIDQGAFESMRLRCCPDCKRIAPEVSIVCECKRQYWDNDNETWFPA